MYGATPRKSRDRGLFRTELSFPVDGREGHESAAEDEDVGERKGEAPPVDVEHGCCGAVLCRMSSLLHQYEEACRVSRVGVDRWREYMVLCC